MRSLGFLVIATTSLALLIAGVGCSSKSSGKSGSTADSKSDGKSGSAGGHGKHEHSATVTASLAKLSETDRASAEKQMMCPVSDEHLGSMGVPIKLTVKGKDVWICCNACKESMEKDPEKYLAKLKK